MGFDISKIDKNFEIQQATDFNSNVYKMPHPLFTIYGGWYEEGFGFVKMPPKTAEEVSSGVLWGSRCTSGVRLAFATDSQTIKLTCNPYQKGLSCHMTLLARAGFTLCEQTADGEKFIGNFYPPIESTGEYQMQLNLSGEKKMRNLILHFPLYSGVLDLTVELDEDSKVEKFTKYRDVKPFLYYGSSITQGGCANRPDNTYQALLGQKYDTDYVVLGFSGLARGEYNMATYLGTVDCSVFVCDYDYNAPDLEHLKNTHLPLYKEFRANPKNATTPIIFLSKPDGFRTAGADKRFKVVKQTYEYAKSQGDNNVYLIDGRKIYPKEVREHCSVDGCHPTDLGFYFMYKAIDKVLSKFFK